MLKGISTVNYLEYREVQCHHSHYHHWKGYLWGRKQRDRYFLQLFYPPPHGIFSRGALLKISGEALGGRCSYVRLRQQKVICFVLLKQSFADLSSWLGTLWEKLELPGHPAILQLVGSVRVALSSNQIIAYKHLESRACLIFLQSVIFTGATMMPILCLWIFDCLITSPCNLTMTCSTW